MKLFLVGSCIGDDIVESIAIYNISYGSRGGISGVLGDISEGNVSGVMEQINTQLTDKI